MLPLGMVLGWAGYGLATWGYILVKGENITLREWFSPFHPFTGSLGSNGKVPQGSIFPTSSASGGGQPGASPSPIQRQQQQNLRTDPSPHGFVQ